MCDGRLLPSLSLFSGVEAEFMVWMLPTEEPQPHEENVIRAK